MKYMTKQFGNGDEAWNDGDLLFNAIIWDTSTRMWGAASELTAIMKRPKTNSDIIWDSIELLIPGAQFTVWTRHDGTLNPPFIELQETEQEPDDLCPDDKITKWLWTTKYESRYRTYCH
jgi:hypothetical protein